MYILIAIFSYWFAGMSKIPTYVKNVLFNFGIKKGDLPIRLKPFDCEKCLAFWMCVWYFLFPKLFPVIIIYAGCASFAAILIQILISKIR